MERQLIASICTEATVVHHLMGGRKTLLSPASTRTTSTQMRRTLALCKLIAACTCLHCILSDALTAGTMTMQSITLHTTPISAKLACTYSMMTRS